MMKFRSKEQIWDGKVECLICRYARADAAKRLLDAGADANSQDNTGRTPLHAAVAADAMGVFQILLRNRATNLNARMHDGTTPLILAARLAIEGMVEDLINADADINAADNSGKTALHWAAAVNNVDAVNVLLAHGANRDAQDDKVNQYCINNSGTKTTLSYETAANISLWITQNKNLACKA